MYEKMKEAISQAEIAAQKGEVPIGCAIYYEDKLIISTHNTCEADSDPIEHAEFKALKYAIKNLGRQKLKKSELYVTLEPCPMCAGAIIHSGVGKVVFGAYDNDFGAYDGYVNLFNHPYAKSIEVYGGIEEEKCSKLIKDFFKDLRG